jgi:pyridoxal phosphate enzyme (YggS family)
MLITKEELLDNLGAVKRHISDAAERVGRSPEEITLVAVTKGRPQEVVELAREIGLCDIGENRVQEAEQKLKAPLPGMAYHLVGHLQKNKAKRAARLFDVIHSVDSVELGDRLSRAAEELQKSLQILVQVNVAEDRAKFGINEDQTLELVTRLAPKKDIEVVGLMTIGPLVNDPEKSRCYFRRLRKLRDEIQQHHTKLEQLSMGMTADYHVAVEEGATMVRVGTALFGERYPSAGR